MPSFKKHRRQVIDDILAKYNIPQERLGVTSPEPTTREKARMRYIQSGARALDIMFLQMLKPGMTWKYSAKLGGTFTFEVYKAQKSKKPSSRQR